MTHDDRMTPSAAAWLRAVCLLHGLTVRQVAKVRAAGMAKRARVVAVGVMRDGGRFTFEEIGVRLKVGRANTYRVYTERWMAQVPPEVRAEFTRRAGAVARRGLR